MRMPDIAEDLIYDIQTPVFLKSGVLWMILMGLLVAMVIGYWIFLKITQQKKEPPQTLESLWEKSIRSLLELRIPVQATRDKVKVFYITLSNVIRGYIDKRFQIPAGKMTTEEFMVEAQKSTLLNEEHKGFLKELLIFSDHVKFAKFIPSPEEMKRMLDLSKLFLGKTKPPEEEAEEMI